MASTSASRERIVASPCRQQQNQQQDEVALGKQLHSPESSRAQLFINSEQKVIKTYGKQFAKWNSSKDVFGPETTLVQSETQTKQG